MKAQSIACISAICAFAAATAIAENRLWNPADDANKDFADGSNWNPTFDLTGDVSSADVTVDEAGFDCRLRVNSAGKLEISRPSGFIVIVK